MVLLEASDVCVIFWIIINFFMYKTDRRSVIIPLLLGISQFGIIVLIETNDYFIVLEQYGLLLLIGLVFLLFGIYKFYLGLKDWQEERD